MALCQCRSHSPTVCLFPPRIFRRRRFSDLCMAEDLRSFCPGSLRAGGGGILSPVQARSCDNFQLEAFAPKEYSRRRPGFIHQRRRYKAWAWVPRPLARQGSQWLSLRWDLVHFGVSSNHERSELPRERRGGCLRHELASCSSTACRVTRRRHGCIRERQASHSFTVTILPRAASFQALRIRQNILGHAKTFLGELEEQRRDALGRPLVFVVHSPGGLLLEAVLRQASEADTTTTDGRHSRICESTVGAIFLGTPHRGSTYARPAELVAGVARVACFTKA